MLSKLSNWTQEGYNYFNRQIENNLYVQSVKITKQNISYFDRITVKITEKFHDDRAKTYSAV